MVFHKGLIFGGDQAPRPATWGYGRFLPAAYPPFGWGKCRRFPLAPNALRAGVASGIRERSHLVTGNLQLKGLGVSLYRRIQTHG